MAVTIELIENSLIGADPNGCRDIETLRTRALSLAALTAGTNLLRLAAFTHYPQTWIAEQVRGWMKAGYIVGGRYSARCPRETLPPRCQWMVGALLNDNEHAFEAPPEPHEDPPARPEPQPVAATSEPAPVADEAPAVKAAAEPGRPSKPGAFKNYASRLYLKIVQGGFYPSTARSSLGKNRFEEAIRLRVAAGFPAESGKITSKFFRSDDAPAVEAPATQDAAPVESPSGEGWNVTIPLPAEPLTVVEGAPSSAAFDKLYQEIFPPMPALSEKDPDPDPQPREFEPPVAPPPPEKIDSRSGNPSYGFSEITLTVRDGRVNCTARVDDDQIVIIGSTDLHVQLAQQVLDWSWARRNAATR